MLPEEVGLRSREIVAPKSWEPRQVPKKSRQLAARPEGIEPPALGFEGRCSIQLSYGRKPFNYKYLG